MPDFTKNEHFLPPDTHTYVCASGSKKCSFFRKIWHAMFSWNIRFEICPFPLLPKITNIFCQMNRAALTPLPNYFMFSLLTCLYCCWPVSIIALIKSSEVGWVDLIVSRNSFGEIESICSGTVLLRYLFLSVATKSHPFT